MTSLHVIYGLAHFPNQKSWLRLCIKPCALCILDTGCCICVLLRAPSRVVTCNVAKLQNIRCIASSRKVLWYGSMEWNMEENFSMEWKIFSMEWKKIASMEYGKIIFHSISCHALVITCPPVYSVVEVIHGPSS